MRHPTDVLGVEQKRDTTLPADSPTPLPLRDPTAWRDALGAWIVQRIILLAITYVGVAVIHPSSTSGVRTSWAVVIAPWTAWDAHFYALIAQGGYASPVLVAYYPLYPLLVHVLAPLAGGSAVLAGLVAANAACLGAFGLLRVLVEREMGRESARRTLIYVTLFPSAFFLAAAYTEALFLLLCVAAFLALRSNRWLVAGVLAALATLTRPVGILLVLSLAVACVQRLRSPRAPVCTREAGAMAAGLILPLGALAGFWVFLYRQFGTTDVILHSEQYTYWRRAITWPWIGFARSGHALLQEGFVPGANQAHILLDAAFTVALIVLTIATIRRLPLPYVVYALASLAVILMTPSHNWYALGSNVRFMLLVFPIFLLLGRWGTHPHVDRALLLASAVLFTLLATIFVTGGWVA